MRSQISQIVIAALALLPMAGYPHGLAGKRFFPATIATDDPFVSDELSLPTVSTSRSADAPDEPLTRETSIALDFSKRITPDFGLSLGAAYLHQSPSGQPSTNGFDNIALGAKYQFYRSDAHETLLSVGVDWDVGGTGSKRVGAESFSTIAPTFFFGKGFGDLPQDMPYLKPFAVTGTIGVAFPTSASSTNVAIDPDTGATVTDIEHHAHVLQVGFSVQYSLLYMQQFVKDVGLVAPFDRMIPLVEVSLQKPLDRVADRKMTGTINPGLIWLGRYTQVAVEAIIPINSQSGHGVGAQAQLHWFLDDLFPHSIGRPLTGP